MGFADIDLRLSSLLRTFLLVTTTPSGVHDRATSSGGRGREFGVADGRGHGAGAQVNRPGSRTHQFGEARRKQLLVSWELP